MNILHLIPVGHVSFNPGFQTLLDANDVNQIGNAKVACIKYQVNWPGTGDQSFNADVGTRVSHYGVWSSKRSY